MSAGYAKTGLYIDYTNHGSFSSGHAQFSSKKDEKGTGTFSGKAPALPHASGNPVEVLAVLWSSSKRPKQLI